MNLLVFMTPEIVPFVADDPSGATVIVTSRSPTAIVAAGKTNAKFAVAAPVGPLAHTSPVRVLWRNVTSGLATEPLTDDESIGQTSEPLHVGGVEGASAFSSPL